MTVFAWIALFILLAPIGKAIADRISAAPTKGTDADLRRELELLQGQLTEAQARLTGMESRLDFYEKLLEERRPASLPRPPGEADARSGHG